MRVLKIIRNLLSDSPTRSDESDNGDEISDADQEDTDQLEDYATIVHSSKYADSNSNTEQLEKLLALIDIKSEQNDEGTLTEAQRTEEEERIKNKVSIESIICRDSDEILPGQPCYRPAKFGKQGGVCFNLRKFDIPRYIFRAIAANNVECLHLTEPLGPHNYVKKFQTLLWVEEAQQSLEMERYTMCNVMLGKLEDFFVLEIAGLAEGRPSLLRGDRLIVRSDNRSSYYEGYIYEVREKDILFKLHEQLHTTLMDGLRFTVDFMSSRTPFRRSHHGVLQFKERAGVKEIVFPLYNHDKPGPLVRLRHEENETNFPCFNTKLNVYQRRAILNVLRAESRPAPYIIFGPPGTGKTVTMVEAILQVYARTSVHKILVCANSNASADLLASRIKTSSVMKGEKELIRVSAFYRMEKLVPPDLEDITIDMDGLDARSYEQCRVVVTTCIQSGSLYEFKDKFDFVFIDEAGHASEPEALIPIGLLNRGGCCVLAGDPHQLGPICVSRVADQHGMGTSMLERLCRRSLYERNHLNSDNKVDYNNRYITKLRICYRCDARVLSINNELFYDNDLKYVNTTPQHWMDAMKVDHPLVFHCVKGRDRREYTNPSWFNPAEAIRCLSYVKRLYDSGLRASQLGIITPYRRQIDKMNLLFESCNLEKCKIATMEEFQGDEREIIIVSTVRTREKIIDLDRKFQLGFLFNPRRFNVAVSRAKWMVIVVGDRRILERDHCWSRYIKRAHNFEDVCA